MRWLRPRLPPERATRLRQLVAGGLAVVGEQGGTLVEPVGVGALDRGGDCSVRARSRFRELGAVGDLLCQRVLEHIPGAAVRAVGDDQLSAGERRDRLGQLAAGRDRRPR